MPRDSDSQETLARRGASYISLRDTHYLSVRFYTFQDEVSLCRLYMHYDPNGLNCRRGHAHFGTNAAALQRIMPVLDGLMFIPPVDGSVTLREYRQRTWQTRRQGSYSLLHADEAVLAEITPRPRRLVPSAVLSEAALRHAARVHHAIAHRALALISRSMVVAHLTNSGTRSHQGHSYSVQPRSRSATR